MFLDKKLFKQFASFGAVGGIGVVVNTALLYSLSKLFHYLLASIIATEAAILSNFFLNNAFTFKGEGELAFKKKLLRFQLLSISTLAGTVSILWVLTSLLGEELLLAWNLAAITVMFAANFTLNKKYTWREGTGGAS